MIGRSDVEQVLVEDEAMLERVARLLEARSELSSWPEDLRAALALALTDAATSRAESWKAVLLRRHLFGPADRIPDHLAMLSPPATQGTTSTGSPGTRGPPGRGSPPGARSAVQGRQRRRA